MNLKSLVPWRSRRSRPAPRDDFGDPLVTLRREMNRMLDEVFPEGWPGSIARAAMPAIDVEESGNEIIVTAELPGVRNKDIEVKLAGSTLTIRGEKKMDRERAAHNDHRLERRFGSFERTIRLPFEASGDKVKASFANGVLAVHVPKPPESQRQVKRIEVKAG